MQKVTRRAFIVTREFTVTGRVIVNDENDDEEMQALYDALDNIFLDYRFTHWTTSSLTTGSTERMRDE